VPLSQYPTNGPVITALVIDRTERLWVRLWAPAAERAATWIIFDAEGRATARVQMPVTTLFADAGVDYLLVRELDELDVASVRVYTIRSPER
jgi:hypothetical protein